MSQSETAIKVSRHPVRVVELCILKGYERTAVSDCEPSLGGGRAPTRSLAKLGLS